MGKNNLREDVGVRRFPDGAGAPRSTHAPLEPAIDFRPKAELHGQFHIDGPLRGAVELRLSGVQ